MDSPVLLTAITEDDVLITEQLWQRSPRSPNLESENRILRGLGRQLNKPAQALLKHFIEIAKDLCQAGTAGVSLIEATPNGKEVFSWVASGTYGGFEDATTPRDFSPCGVCLRRGYAQLYSYPARYFTYLQQAEPIIVESLVVPLVLEGRSLGTIWILSHDEQQQFDSEDLRVMTSLADFLAAAIANARMRQTIEESACREQVARESAEAAQAQLESVLSSINDSFVVVDVAEREQVQALEQSEERFRQMADIIEAVFWLFDVVKQQILYVSPAYESIWGRDRQRLYTHPNEFIESLHPDDRERIQSAISCCILQERFEVEYRVVRPDGEVRWVRDRGFLIRRNGKPYQIAGFAEDITEYKQTELLLVEQKRLLEMTASGYPLDECLSSVCTSIAKLDPGVRACILLTDAQRQTFPRSITPDFPPSFGQGLKDAPINELAIGTCGTAVYCGRPISCVDIANDARWSQGWRDLCVAHGILGCHSEPILGVDDKPLGSLMLCFDKTRQPTEWEYRLADFGTHIASIVFERDRTNRALRESEARFRRVFDCNMLGMGVWAKSGSITEANDALLNLIGYTRQELEAGAIDWRELTPPEYHHVDERALAEIAATGVSTLFEKEYIHKSGRRVPLLIGGASFLSTADSGVFFALDLSERRQFEVQLRENEERLKLVLEAVDMVAWEWNPFQNTIITTANFPQIYGLSEIQTAEQGFALVHPDDRSRHQAIVKKAVATSSGYYSEFRFIRPDNEATIWLEERGKAILDSKGSLQKLIGVTMDITERKQAEEVLRRSEERYRTLFESIDEGFCVIEMLFDEQDKPLDYRLLEVNPAFEKQTGLQQALGKTARQLVPDLEAHWFEIYGKVALTGEPMRFENGSREMNRWFDVYAFRIGQPESRKVALIFQDITARKQTEAALQDSEERFRNMADNAPVMVWVTDSTGYCTYLSRSWYDFSGQTEATGLGFGWLDAVHPGDSEVSKNIFLNANKHQKAFQLEYRLQRKDGEYRTCIDAASPWFGIDGQFKGYIGSAIDITERKQAELQLQHQAKELTELNQSLRRTSELLAERNQELNSFTYTVSHDLKAPLRAIANLSQWIADDLEGRLDEDNQRQIQLLQSRVERMGAMIDGLLTYSRVGRTEVATQSVDVGVLLNEILDSLAPPPTFTIKILSELPTIVGKRLLLSQVLANLIGNAIKHHPRTDGQVKISAAQKGQDYEFAIADDGAGIAPENHEKIFGIFQVLNSRDVRESTGIGLAIVKKIVETEGGAITLESELGSGATFRFTWPEQSLTH